MDRIKWVTRESWGVSLEDEPNAMKVLVCRNGHPDAEVEDHVEFRFLEALDQLKLNDRGELNSLIDRCGFLFSIKDVSLSVEDGCERYSGIDPDGYDLELSEGILVASECRECGCLILAPTPAGTSQVIMTLVSEMADGVLFYVYQDDDMDKDLLRIDGYCGDCLEMLDAEGTPPEGALWIHDVRSFMLRYGILEEGPNASDN